MKIIVIMLVLATLIESRPGPSVKCRGRKCNEATKRPKLPTRPARVGRCRARNFFCTGTHQPTRPTQRPKDLTWKVNGLEKDMKDVKSGMKDIEEKLDGMKESQDKFNEAAAALVEVLGGNR